MSVYETKVDQNERRNRGSKLSRNAWLLTGIVIAVLAVIAGLFIWSAT